MKQISYTKKRSRGNNIVDVIGGEKFCMFDKVSQAYCCHIWDCYDFAGVLFDVIFKIMIDDKTIKEVNEE